LVHASRSQRPFACHDELVIECDADKAEEGKEWLVQAMKDGMDAVVNVLEPYILIEMEASVSKSWGG
jgi:DNA polymerase I-like protein with 3'-5' exonuclease and polymerase domains